MSTSQQPGPEGSPQAYVQPKSGLELRVEGLREGRMHHKIDPLNPSIEELEVSVADIILFEVTDADKKSFKTILSVEERVARTLRLEPYRTRLQRIDNDVHDKRQRYRQRVAIILPLTEKAIDDAIADLAELCRRRRRVS